MIRPALVRVLVLAASVALIGGSPSLGASPIRQLTQTNASNLRPVWSPDGKRIAFQSNRDGPYHIYVMDSDGGNVRQLTSGDADDRHPAWSPDGKRIAVDSGSNVNREIWVIDMASRARTQLTRIGAITSFPSWSPDGTRLSYYVYRDGVMDIWVTNAGGGDTVQLTSQLASERNNQCTFACHSPAWSPDGRQLAFSDGDHSRVLLMASAIGATPSPISPKEERSHFPSYLPDGRIVYVSEFVTPDTSYTDLWAVDPSAADQRTAVAKGVLAQGPFELTGDAGELLFASPRSGNFEIYAVTLDDAGKAALATRPDPVKPFEAGNLPETRRVAAVDPLIAAAPWALGGAAIVLMLGGLALLGRARRTQP